METPTPVSCHRCGATALVTKNSFEHLSVEWQVDANEVCEEISTATRTTHQPPARVARCDAMDETIREGVRAGRIPVGGEDISDTLQQHG